MSKSNRKEKWLSVWRFSSRERRALLYLLPILAVASWLIYEITRQRFDDTFTGYADMVNAEKQSTPDSASPTSPTSPATPVIKDSLFTFDPNTIEYHDLCRLGFTRNEALGIVKYRERGKVFQISADFASCYQVSEEMYLKLRPYIDIGEKYGLRSETAHPTRDSGRAQQPKTSWEPRPLSLDTITVEGVRELGFSVRQAEVIINYRDMRGGFGTAGEFAECYVVSDEMFAQLEPYLVFPEKQIAQATSPTLINLNTADSAALRSIRGVGEKTVVTIMDYRRRLGGFHTIGQLAEVAGVTEQNYDRICKQIFIDSCDIQKIDVNFALAKDLGEHPYIESKTLRKLLKLRQLKGGWSTNVELIEDKIMTPAEAEKLAPYLLFRQHEQ